MQALARINDNFYKLAFYGKYSVNATIKVSNFSPFNVGVVKSRRNPLKRGGNDGNISKDTKRHNATHLKQT